MPFLKRCRVKKANFLKVNTRGDTFYSRTSYLRCTNSRVGNIAPALNVGGGKINEE